jgi:hypothetical protein
MNVPNQLSQIAIRLTEDRLISPLKQVANLLVLSVVILTVSGQQSVHCPTDRILDHLNQQVYVIGHQAVGIKIEGPFVFLRLEKGQEPKIVIMRAENAPAIIAARDYVIEPAGYLDSGSPRHGEQQYIQDYSNVNISCLTPSTPFFCSGLNQNQKSKLMRRHKASEHVSVSHYDQPDYRSQCDRVP